MYRVRFSLNEKNQRFMGGFQRRNKVLILGVGMLMFCVESGAQIMQTQTYQDATIDYIELDPTRYDFDFPIRADVLDSPNYTPNSTDLYYLKATYGSRYLSYRSTRSDNHGGLDFWNTIKNDGIAHSDANKYPIICMCDGVISETENGTDAAMEATSEGRSVQVTCDSNYQTIGSDIKINYRHLDSLWSTPWAAWNTASTTTRMNKGDTIGIVGESGSTSNVHLHLSIEGSHPDYGNAHLSAYRVFDPTKSSAVIGTLTSAKIELLADWPDSALFRVIWPFNMSINRFEFINDGFSSVFDVEEAYDQGSSTRDDHDVLNGFGVFSYQFNGKQTAKSRYDSEKPDIPAEYPASPQRDTNTTIWGYTHFPVTYDSIGFVYDFVVKGLPNVHSADNFIVKLSDVWGYTVQGNFAATLPVELVSFNARKEGAQRVKLDWETATETNNDHFDVERSQDGLEWYSIGKLKGQGTSISAHQYFHIDENPVFGQNYYRLKQHDFNGQCHYSSVRVIDLNDEETALHIYPNPTRDLLFVAGNSERLKVLELFDPMGQKAVVTYRQIEDNLVAIDLSSLKKGVYFLKAEGGSQMIQKI